MAVAYIVRARTDLPAGAVQITDLAPNSSQRTVYQMAGQSGYLPPLYQDDTIVGYTAANITTAVRVGLAAWAVDTIAVLAGPNFGMTEADADDIADDIFAAAQAALAAGTTAGVLQRLAKETENRPDLEEILHPLQSEWSSLSKDILQSDEVTVTSGETPETIRRRANSLVLRAAQAYLGATKGAGFVQGHPAERAVREAMFFLVWSCPQPVLTAALREFACIG